MGVRNLRRGVSWSRQGRKTVDGSWLKVESSSQRLPPNKESIFRRTSSFIFMSGGHGLLKPSPGNFFVASIPNFEPIAISEVAWSSTSDGPLVKMLSRCGSVLAQRRKRTSLVLWTSDGRAQALVVHHHDVFGPARRDHLPHAPEAVHDLVGLHREGLADAHEDEVVEDAFRRQRDIDDLGEVHLEPSPPGPLPSDGRG